jgi:hypothetical protein
VSRSSGFFQGSELPRLCILAVVTVVGWGLVWHYAHKAPEPAEPQATATATPEPLVPDRSIEFESVTDRTPLEFRDNGAYDLLLMRARGKTPAELAAVARHDVVLANLWQNPEQYRGVPIHLLGAAMRVLRYPSKLSKAGWLYEAWVVTPETSRVPYVCVFEEAPEGLPIGHDINERVVFNGYFLKIMRYTAADGVSRGAPVLVGRIGWVPPAVSSAEKTNPTLFWSLVILGVLFFVSLGRWIYQVRPLFASPGRSPHVSSVHPIEEIDAGALDEWARSMAPEDGSTSEVENTGEN